MRIDAPDPICDRCSDFSCPKCDPDLILAELAAKRDPSLILAGQMATAIDCIVTGKPFQECRGTP